MTAMPPIKPSHDFDPERQPRTAEACWELFRVLSDREWHARSEVIDKLILATDFKPKSIASLISGLKSHGDVRTWNGRVALTTRWWD